MYTWQKHRSTSIVRGCYCRFFFPTWHIGHLVSKKQNDLCMISSLRRALTVYGTIYGIGCSFFSSLNLIQSQRRPAPAFKTQTSVFNSLHIHIQIQSISHRPSFTSLSPPQTIKNLCLRFGLQPRGADRSR